MPPHQGTVQLRLELGRCETQRVKVPVLAATPLIAALAWVVALIIDSEPWDGTAALLIGVGLITVTTVGLVGLVVGSSRWAHRSLLGVLFTEGLIAVFRDVDFVWGLALGFTALALIALTTPTILGAIRKLPAASGPSPRAIGPALYLLFVPLALGLAATDSVSWAVLTVGLSAPIAAFLFSRVFPGGLLTVRVVWPAAAISLAPAMGWPTGAVSAALGIGLLVLAWHSDVKASFHPPVESGTTFPIPPELAPSEILDAAGIDDQGKPL